VAAVELVQVTLERVTLEQVTLSEAGKGDSAAPIADSVTVTSPGWLMYDDDAVSYLLRGDASDPSFCRMNAQPDVPWTSGQPASDYAAKVTFTQYEEVTVQITSDSP
jgi:hypothetical protein